MLFSKSGHGSESDWNYFTKACKFGLKISKHFSETGNEGDFADTGAGKFPLVSMGGRAEGLACADPGARTPIGASGNV